MIALGSSADAQDPAPVEVPVAPNEIRAALEQAEARLEERRREFTEETQNRNRAIAERQASVFELQDRQQALRDQLRALDRELVDLDEKSSESEAAVKQKETGLESLASEVESQRFDLDGRIRHSLLGLEQPELIERIDALKLRDDDERSPEERAEALLSVHADVLAAADAIGKMETEARLSAKGGEVKNVRALRLGLLGGFYSDPDGGESGFLTPDIEGEPGSFVGQSTGLTAEQKARIAMYIDDPSDGGVLPFDVTGGAGIAILQSEDTLARWFEVGGKFMYPLVALALIALVLSIERGISLALRSAGMKRRLRAVIAHVEAGRFDAAEALVDKSRGAVGSVCRAALVHRSQGRAVMEDAVQEALLHHAPSFHSRLSFIALCAAIAPLMGLLGTVTGMITTFKAVTVFGTSDPRYMAGGISEALITTQGGLYVAIPALLLRGVLGAAADASVGRLEAGALSLVRAILVRTGKSPDDEPEGDGDVSTASGAVDSTLAGSTGRFLGSAQDREDAEAEDRLFAALEGIEDVDEVDEVDRASPPFRRPSDRSAEIGGELGHE